MNLHIILSGGGAQCAWQAGVFEGLRHGGIFWDHDITKLRGTSGGALNSAAIYAGDELKLRDMWTRIVPNWFYLMLGSGLIKRLIKKLFDPFKSKGGIDFKFNAVSIYDGKEYIWGPGDFLDKQNYHRALYASACQPTPFFFRSVKKIYTTDGIVRSVADGGIKNRVLFHNLDQDELVIVIDCDPGLTRCFKGRNFLVEPTAAFRIAAAKCENYPYQCFVIKPNKQEIMNGDIIEPFDFSKMSLKKTYNAGVETGKREAEQILSYINCNV